MRDCSSTHDHPVDKGHLFVQGIIKMALAEEMFLLLQIILSCFLQSFHAITMKRPIKKALNLAFPLAISDKLLSDTFIFGVRMLESRIKKHKWRAEKATEHQRTDK